MHKTKERKLDLVDIRETVKISQALAKKHFSEGNVGPGITILQTCLDSIVSSASISNHEKNFIESAPNARGCNSGKDSESEEEARELKLSVQKCIKKVEQGKEWTSVIGQSKAKNALEESIVWPLKYPGLFSKDRPSSRSILLYGPPGVGKTELALTAASISNATFYDVRGSDVKSMWYGKSDKFVRALFQDARSQDKAVIFFDEVDGLLGLISSGEKKTGDGVVNEFLCEMNAVMDPKLEQSVVVIAATNYPDSLGSSVLRRFQSAIRLDMPNEVELGEMFQMYLGHLPHTIQVKQLKVLAKMSQGFSGSDVKTFVREASLEPIREIAAQSESFDVSAAVRKFIELRHFQATRKRVSNTVPQDMIDQLDKFDEKLGCSKNPIGCTSQRRGISTFVRNIFI